MDSIDVIAMGLTFGLVMFITVALCDKAGKWLSRRRANKILRIIDWPKPEVSEEVRRRMHALRAFTDNVK